MDYAPLSELIRLRSYSRRREDGKRESWEDTCYRTLYSEHLGLKVLGEFTEEEISLIDEMQRKCIAFGSSRWLWVGGTPWVTKPENYPGCFNCTTTRLIDWDSFGNLMDLAMQGAGTGCSVEIKYINRLPAIRNRINLAVIGEPGEKNSIEETTVTCSNNRFLVQVGDSRRGWVKAYQTLLELASDCFEGREVELYIDVDIRHVRPAGSPLKGFGGVANPIRLRPMFEKVAQVLNSAVGRQLNSLECCLIVDAAASAVVAGNIRRSAGIRQGSSEDLVFADAKKNLWQQDEDGNWRIDPWRDDLRMANHTRVFHRKPTYKEILDAVQKQFFSSEGAIQYAPEAIARANVDVLDTYDKKVAFINAYNQSPQLASFYLSSQLDNKTGLSTELDPEVLIHRISRYELNPCGEIIGSDLFCNLASVHLNQVDPFDLGLQKKAFRASALQASAYLKRGFVNPRYQRSRELDPIVGVSFTGAFTFFAKAFGIDWLRWWQDGRSVDWNDYSELGLKRINEIASLFPQWEGYVVGTKAGYMFRDLESRYLSLWKRVVHQTVWDYCDRHGLKRPNRCTTMKPEGSQTLLTGVGCNGFHPPKAWYYIRRMTFAKNDPIALAAIDYGYTVVPSQSDKDDKGLLLTDPFDPRCTEWLVEVPVKEAIADLIPGAESINPNRFSVLAQFDWLMQVQNCYVTHNTSSTLELTEEEIEPLAKRIYQAIENNEGYISATLQARFNAPFPRLPFEVITKEQYELLYQSVLSRRKSDDFQALVDRYDSSRGIYLSSDQPQDSACSSDACELRASSPNQALSQNQA